MDPASTVSVFGTKIAEDSTCDGRNNFNLQHIMPYQEFNHAKNKRKNT